MSLLDDVNQALRRGAYDAAADLALAGLARGEAHPTLFNVAAFHHSEAGRYEEALDLLHRGLDLTPEDPHILYSAGFCLARLGRDEAAMIAFGSALAAKPGFPAPLNQMGLIHERRGEEAAAIRCYERAIAGDPNFEDAYAGRASVAAGLGDFALARAYAQKALDIAPGQPLAHLAIAKADFADGRFEAVIACLRPVLPTPGPFIADRPAFLALIGDALNALGETEEAFATWSEAKSLSHELFAGTPIAEAAAATLERLTALRDFFDTLGPMAAETAVSPAAAGPPRRHVFLVGFPRSGTTLLEQVLATHSDVVTLEEKPLLADAEDAYLSSPAAFQRLIEASQAELDPFRAAYWQAVEARGLAVQDKIFIDKFPLSSLLLPLIARLFPTARILFAERDPRDVVLSCFRRSFKMNPAMYQFVTLDGAARFYSSVMGLADRYRLWVPLGVQAVRYETVVADFEAECRRICAFLDLEWTPEMNDFAAAARRRAIHTPSASQVRKGLYADGVGQWRRFSRQMAPALPILAPWVKALGYDAHGDPA